MCPSQKRVTSEAENPASPEYEQNRNANNQQIPSAHDDIFDGLSPLEEAKNFISPSLIMTPPRDHNHNHNHVHKYPSSPQFLPPSPPMIRTIRTRLDFDRLTKNDEVDFFYTSRSDDEGLMLVSSSEDDEAKSNYTRRHNRGGTFQLPCHFSSSPSTELVGAGLTNLGNTCFMNAILQCFTHTVPLVNELRSCSHITPCEDYDADDDDRFCAICVLRQHIEICITCSGGIVSPGGVVDSLGKFSSSFRRYQQDDAHEFMLCVLNKLKKCFVEGEENMINRVFGGRLISKLQCSSCGHTSNSYEPMIDLSLEVEDAATIQDALKSFTMVEKMDVEFTCDGCSEEVSMKKQLMLNQVPQVLAFHLKRFKKDGDNLMKIDAPVYFTLELDLEDYIFRSSNDDNVNLKYDLYAVVVHVGSNPHSGHYYCIVRSDAEKWHKLDDDQVTSVSEDNVLHQQAYILFYAKQGTPWFSSSIIIKGDKEPKVPNLKQDFDDEAEKHNVGDENYDDDPLDAYNDDVDVE